MLEPYKGPETPEPEPYRPETPKRNRGPDSRSSDHIDREPALEQARYVVRPRASPPGAKLGRFVS